MLRWLPWSIVLLCAYAGAQVQPILQPHQTFVDGSGSPCAGCSLYSYAAGTTTPHPTYTDASGLVQNTNPVILDAAGGANIWPDTSSYKFVLVDTSGTTLWTVDNVKGPIPGSSGPFLPLTGGSLTGALAAPSFQFTGATSESCPVGEFVEGWGTSGWICNTPGLVGAAGGDLSGTYPNPVVAQINGAAVPTSATLVGTNASKQLVTQTGTISNNTSGNAATATALAASPTQCTGTDYAQGIAANGNANCHTLSVPIIKSGTAAGCTTGSSSYDVCNVTVSFGSSFSDTGYAVSCSAVDSNVIGGGSSDALTVTVLSKAVGSVSVAIQTQRSNTASPSEIGCVAVHP
ncbi:MAG TPA: hypothetical protein VKX41_09595 [Alloacidobacterium sp.]|jgi:hypothetical protein|nr:hypothetical protein [Alloacidobacterium sp.]